jgi:hypothetical protein
MSYKFVWHLVVACKTGGEGARVFELPRSQVWAVVLHSSLSATAVLPVANFQVQAHVVVHLYEVL